MPAPGAQFGSMVGVNSVLAILASSGATTYAMAALNTGFCVRFTATSTNDIKSARIFWSSVSAPGTNGITLRIETIDKATGKPSGTLYDANATITFTAASGIQTYTFATTPTTGLVVGDEYAIVLLTVVAGTTQTLGAYSSSAFLSTYPTIVLTAADGTTRTNFAEVASSIPMLSLIDDLDIEIPEAFLPFQTTTGTVQYVFSTTNFVAQKFIINSTQNIAGVACMLIRTGTPAGDLRIRIFDSSNNVISGTTVTIDKDSLLNVTNRRIIIIFPAVVALIADTYRIVFDSSGSANSSNAFGLRPCSFLNSACVNPWRLSTSSDAASWTDSTTAQVAVWLLLDNFVAGGGGGGKLIGGRLIG